MNKQSAIILSAILLIVICGKAFAEEPWYEAYDSAQKALTAQNWSLAEQKLKIAMKQQPKPGRQVKAYGSRFIFYVPDYYLGLVYFYQGKYQESLDQFQRVQSSRVLEKGDAEFAQMSELIKLAKEKLTPPAGEDLKAKELQRQTDHETDQLIEEIQTFTVQERLEEARKGLKTLKEKAPSHERIGDLSASIAQKETELQAKSQEQQKQTEQAALQKQTAELVRQAREALASRDYALARKRLKQAGEIGVTGGEVNDLARSVDVAEKLDALEVAVSRMNWVEAKRAALQLEALDPQNAGLKRMQPLIEKGMSAMNTTELAHRALRSFYMGDYRQAATLFGMLAAEKNASAGVYFYLACSNASLAMLQGGEGKELLQQARLQFAHARKINPAFRPEKKYISPRILQLYLETGGKIEGTP